MEPEGGFRVWILLRWEVGSPVVGSSLEPGEPHAQCPSQPRGPSRERHRPRPAWAPLNWRSRPPDCFRPSCSCLGKGRSGCRGSCDAGRAWEAPVGEVACSLRRGSQLCHRGAAGQGAAARAVPTASSTGTIWARPCPASPHGNSVLTSQQLPPPAQPVTLHPP